MRIVPILTALLVAGFLYFVIAEREKFLGIFNVETEEAAETTSEPEETRSAVSVTAISSTAKEVQSGIVLRGRTEATRRVDIRAETSGTVTSEPLPKGSLVEAGQVLCRIEEGTRAASLAEAEARLAEAETSVAATRELSQKGFASETTALASEAGLQSAQAAVARARQEIERIEMTAPFAGLLDTDTAEIGSLLQPGSLCATVIDLSTVRLVGFVPEADITRLTEGAMAGGRLASGRQVVGQVSYLARSADPLTRTFRLEVEVPNADLSIREGETAEIGISMGEQHAHLLPQSVLVLNDEGRAGIRVAEGDTAKFYPVDIIRDEPNGIWLGGLPDRINVITVGQQYVRDGSLIDATIEGEPQ